MQISRIILPLFIIIPLIEVSLFVIAGDIFGAGPTILTIIITAILGVHFLKQQGTKTFLSFQTKLAHQELPAQELIEGMILLVCGALLITPGFFTDFIGFLGLIPMVRKQLISLLSQRFVGQAHHQSFRSHFEYSQNKYEHDENVSQASGQVYDADFESVPDEPDVIDHQEKKH
jgi:UPF0716 protein FxsA